MPCVRGRRQPLPRQCRELRQDSEPVWASSLDGTPIYLILCPLAT